jgi:hypothetical protein
MNKKVIVAVFIIGGSGVVKSAMAGTAITPVILGSYIFLLVLSVLDAFGGPVSTLAGGLAMVAAVTVLLTEFPWQVILGAIGFNQSSGIKGEKGSTPNPAQPKQQN